MQAPITYTSFNDPVHGFVNIPKGILFDLINHPIFQRMRRIKQIGLGYMIYPGGEHTRFAHAIGAMHLMRTLLNKLKLKGIDISDEEYEAASIAILLHDIGHGPFSHALEHSFINDFHHEMMTLELMKKLNVEFNGCLDLAIKMFENLYERPFFHELISSQLDTDRLDYIRRDSFHTGVREGSIGVDRLLETITVLNDQIYIERKGIYALENYIMARNLMYMQVYLHKTNLSADVLLKQIFKRARHLAYYRQPVQFPSAHIAFFIGQNISASNGLSQEMIDRYLKMDDVDVLMCVKMWQNSGDRILNFLCNRFLDRVLFKTKNIPEPGSLDQNELVRLTCDKLQTLGLPYDEDAASYFYYLQEVVSEAYSSSKNKIRILNKDGSIQEFSEAADTKNIRSLMQAVKKYYVMFLPGLEASFIKVQGQLL